MGPQKPPPSLESAFVCCQAPSSATHPTIAEWGGSEGHGHPRVGTGSRTLPEPNLLINPQRFTGSDLNQMLETPLHFQLGLLHFLSVYVVFVGVF